MSSTEPLPSVPTVSRASFNHAVVETSAKYLVVTNPQEYSAAGEVLKGLKDLKKQVVAHYAAIKDPLNKLKSAVLDMEKTDLAPIGNAIAAVEGLMLGFSERQRQIADAAQRQLQANANAEAEKLSKQLGVEIAAPSVTVDANVPKVAGIHSATTWRAEVVDITLIPRKYLIPDMVALNNLAREHKANFNDHRLVAGVKAVSDTGLKGRG